MSIGLALADRTTLAIPWVVTASLALAAKPSFSVRSVLVPPDLIAAAEPTFPAARSVLASPDLIAAAKLSFTARARATFPAARTARARAAFTTAGVAVMPVERGTVIGCQGGELRCVEFAVTVLVILGKEFGGGVRLFAVISLGADLCMGGGGQREAAKEDRECFVHVVWGVWCVVCCEWLPRLSGARWGPGLNHAGVANRYIRYDAVRGLTWTFKFPRKAWPRLRWSRFAGPSAFNPRGG